MTLIQQHSKVTITSCQSQSQYMLTCDLTEDPLSQDPLHLRRSFTCRLGAPLILSCLQTNWA